jgi:hypothetical protein
MGQSQKGLETVLSQINGANTALVELQRNTTWIKVIEWFSPLVALLVAALVGADGSWWVMNLQYNDSLNVLGRNLVKWNIDRILKC